jgi:hypothetical protein
MVVKQRVRREQEELERVKVSWGDLVLGAD